MGKGRTETLPLYSAFARPGETLPGIPAEKHGLLGYIPFMGSRSPSNSSTRANTTAPGTPSSSSRKESESDSAGFLSGFAKRGVEAAQGGFAKATGGVRSVTTGVQQRTEEASFLLSSQRLMFFLFFAGAGSFFMFLAFLFLPMIMLAPQKFALLFTSGSACMIASLVSIKGFTALFSHLSSRERLPYSIAYILSLFLTLYASLFAHSYLLTFFSAVVQIVTLVSLLISYVPGGTRFLSFVKGQTAGAAKSVIPGMGGKTSQNSGLPV